MTSNPTSFLNLLDLGFDVTQLILDQLNDEGPQDLISFSAISRQAREYTLPNLFGQVEWPKGSRRSVEFYPPSLWPYIRRLSVVYDKDGLWASRQFASLKSLSEALPHLPHLVAFIYAPQRFAPILPLLQASASCSSLQSLRVTTPFFVHDALDLFRSFSGIRRLVIDQPDQATLYSAPESKRALSVQCVSNLLQGCSSTLEHLEIPGEYCPLSDLASHTISLPQLRKFVLGGFPPLDTDSGRYPLWTVLRTMQHLSVVEIHCKLRIIGASPRRFELMPADASPPSGEISLLPTQIESMTISNPSLSDNIVKRLPHSLKCLVLDFIPEWENMLSSGDTLAYHKPGNVLGMFNLVQADRALRSLHPTLEQLCIKMGWCTTPELLRCICELFPGLRALELQGIRYFNRAEEPQSDMAGLVAILEKLQGLHTLKLAVELQEDSYSPSRIRSIGSVNDAMQHWASVLRDKIPSIQRLAFEQRRHTGKGYGRRAALGTPLWIWFLPNHPSSPGSDSMRRSEETFDCNLAELIPTYH